VINNQDKKEPTWLKRLLESLMINTCQNREKVKEEYIQKGGVLTVILDTKNALGTTTMCRYGSSFD
jgi:hypothetical protein